MSYATFTGNASPSYEAEPHVAEIVNLAIALGRPILVEGEAGCGKTMLARAIAWELNLGTPRGTPVSMTVKSSFQARDLLYRFNALRRLQEIQDPRQGQEAKYVYPYVTLQPLGEAIFTSARAVVLIDEIDKADIDFPNDLLQVLDAFAFDIDELPQEEDALCRAAKGFGRRVTGMAETRPIVIITSNREKQLPEPFLRRCLYIQLRFPDDPTVLSTIVRKNLGVDAESLSTELIDAAIARFIALRTEALQAGAQKPPATSELIDWVRVLHWRREAPETVAGATPVPYWRLLFKTVQDVEAYEARAKP